MGKVARYNHGVGFIYRPRGKWTVIDLFVGLRIIVINEKKNFFFITYKSALD